MLLCSYFAYLVRGRSTLTREMPLFSSLGDWVLSYGQMSYNFYLLVKRLWLKPVY